METNFDFSYEKSEKELRSSKVISKSVQGIEEILLIGITFISFIFKTDPLYLK